MEIDIGNPKLPRPVRRKRKARWKLWAMRACFAALHLTLIVGALVWTEILELPRPKQDDPSPKEIARPVAETARPGRRPAPRPIPPRPPAPPDDPFTFDFDAAMAAETAEEEGPEQEAEKPSSAVASAPESPPAGREVPRSRADARKAAALKRLRVAVADGTVRYEKAKQEAREAMLRSFDALRRQAERMPSRAEVGRDDLIASLDQERQAFERDGTLPQGEVMIEAVIRYQLAIFRERRPLLRACERLIDGLDPDESAGEVASLREQIRVMEEEEGETHWTESGTTWAGERRFDDQGEPMDIALKIVEAKAGGDNFVGELNFNHGMAIARVEGRCNGVAIRWRATEMIRDQALQRDWIVEGVLAGNLLYARFQGTNFDGKRGAIPVSGWLVLKSGGRGGATHPYR